MTREVRAWSIWGVRNKWIDLGTTALVVLLLAWSRFAWLPSGPWEWDETLFARGMLHFELAAHFPHPPGFPGWLALGHLLLPFAGQPLRALQVVSATFSILALWPLVILGRRVATPMVAAASSLLVLFLPGPWLFSVRGFSSTTATTIALAAAAVWAGGLHGRRATAFSILLASSFLVRPILLPVLFVLWMCGAATVERRRELLPGVVLSAFLIAFSVAAMAFLEGGWSAFVRPFFDHAGSHASRLYLNGGGVAELGLVRGFGGLTFAGILAIAAICGLMAWARQVGRNALLAWILVFLALIGPLLFLQNRTYARYAVPAQIAAAPLIAGSFGALPALPVAVFLVGGAVCSGWWSLPLLEEQHRTRLAAWAAVLDAEAVARRYGWAVVVDPEVYPFASYRWHVIEGEGRATPPLELSPRAPEGWAGVDRPWVVAAVHSHLYLPSTTGIERVYGTVSTRLERMSQQRLLDATVLENPPLSVGQWWSRARLEDGTPFMWAGPEAELWLPPVPAGSLVGIELRPAPGDTDLAVSLNGRDEISVPGKSGRRWIWFHRRPEHHDRPLVLGLDRPRGYAPGGEDLRPLSVQVFRSEIRPPGMSYEGLVSTSTERQRLRVTIDGAYSPEVFGKHGVGMWLKPDATLQMAIEEPGTLVLSVISARPTDPQLNATIDGVVVAAGPKFVKRAADVAIEITESDIKNGAVEIRLSSEPFVPRDIGHGTDSRQLGVVLQSLSFRPFKLGPLCWWEKDFSEN